MYVRMQMNRLIHNQKTAFSFIFCLQKNRANEESLNKAKLQVHLFSAHLPFLQLNGETAKNKTNQMKRDTTPAAKSIKK